MDAAGLLQEVRACRLCADSLPLGPRPVLQWHPDARILIAGQAPGRRVHASGLPFDDPSGERLRDWLGVDKTVFYDETRIAILPMAFCYPGTGKSGDLPPPPQCAAAWRQPLLAGLPHLQLTILLGQYAQRYHLPGRYPRLTEAVELARALAGLAALAASQPAQSARLRRHPWFEAELLPALRQRVAQVLERG